MRTPAIRVFVTPFCRKILFFAEFGLAACLLLAFLRLVTFMRLAFLVFAISVDLVPINYHSIIVQVAVSQIQRTGFG